MVIADLIKNEKDRMLVLSYVSDIGLPDCWVAAGFVRNTVWDYIHCIPSTPVNDVDVIFFDRLDVEDRMAKSTHEILFRRAPDINWEIKNQAFMHLRNGDPPYQSSKHAMSFWPEIETAVGVRLVEGGNVEVCAPFGVDSLLSGKLTPNPRRPISLVRRRAEEKGWFERWPNLQFDSQPATRGDR